MIRTTRTAVTAAVTIFAMLTGTVLAGPEKGSKAPTKTESPTDTEKAVVIPGTTTPKFDTKPVDADLAKLIARLAGDGDRFLHGAPCDRYDAKGSRNGRYYDHCVSITVGGARAMTSYLLLDTDCPEDDAASACYGGYVILARTEIEINVETEASETTSTTVAKTRFGLKRIKAKRGQSKLPGLDLYVLPGTPAITVTRTASVKNGTHANRITIVDVGGNTLADAERIWIASVGDSPSCADVGALAEGQTNSDYAIATTLVLTIGSIDAAIIGGMVALFGSLTVVGTVAAVTAGGAIFATGVAFSIALANELGKYGAAEAKLAGLEAKLACERHERLDQLPLDALAQLGDIVAEWDGTQTPDGLDNCGGTATATYPDPDNEGYTCSVTVTQDSDCNVTVNPEAVCVP